MAEIIAVDSPLDEDLTAFSRYLWQQRIPHRVVVHEQRQWVLVGTRYDAEQVAAAYSRISAGEPPPDIVRHLPGWRSPGWQIARSPVTVLFVALSIIGYLLFLFDTRFEIIRHLTFFELNIVDNNIALSVNPSHYWRLITPIFLHFGLLHITFNALLLWELGRRVELCQGAARLTGLILLIAMGSNIAQYWYSGANNFGGMSGVVYGLLGYSWIWSRLRPQQSLYVSLPLLYFMLGWLVLCMSGFTVLLGTGAVANAAHLGGLLTGMLLGFCAAQIARYQH